jgi:hypothetical protein
VTVKGCSTGLAKGILPPTWIKDIPAVFSYGSQPDINVVDATIRVHFNARWTDGPWSALESAMSGTGGLRDVLVAASITGRGEKTLPGTWSVLKMNLAIRGSGVLGRCSRRANGHSQA